MEDKCLVSMEAGSKKIIIYIYIYIYKYIIQNSILYHTMIFLIIITLYVTI